MITCLVSFSRIYVLDSWYNSKWDYKYKLNIKYAIYNLSRAKLSCHVIISHHMSAI